MSRQYFDDTLTEPIQAAYTTITAITETVLIPTFFTTIGAGEPRTGKVYELIVGGNCTTGTAGTLTITPRYGTTISGTSLGISGAQNYVPSVSNTGFIFRCYLIIRGIGLPGGANSSAFCSYNWSSGGAVATAASETAITGSTLTSAVAIDTSVASALWIGVTFSVAPSVLPQWHVFRSFN